ncbi:MAG: HD domain-containing protein [Solobacterium sp.]|nr:HD domain-containing protein [Solobacterium sp.]
MNDKRFCFSAETDASVLKEKLLSFAAERQMENLARAVEYAETKHDGQWRKKTDAAAADVPYIRHPFLLAYHAAACGFADEDLLCAMLLHDVPEDTGTAAEDLPFPARVQAIVALVTKKKGYIEEEYYAAIAKDPDACTVKLFDRCGNLSEMYAGFKTEKMGQYVEETVTYILPLADAAVKRHGEKVFPVLYQMDALVNTIRRLTKG